MESPVLALTDWIAASPYRVAPEKAHELAQFLSETKVAITVSPAPGFAFFVDVTAASPRNIQITVAALELIWCAAHAYCVLFDEYKKAFERKEVFFDVGAVPRARNALTLYNWALAKCEDKTDVSWPTLDILPRKDAPSQSDIHAANEMFLTAVAWILLHELAHVRLNHSWVRTRSQAEEREADRAATDWILPPPQDLDSLSKRILGAAVATLVLTARDLRARTFDSSSHPRSFERLLYCLEQSSIPEDHLLYKVVFVLLQIHLDWSQVPFDAPDASFRVKCEEACLALHTAATSNG